MPTKTTTADHRALDEITFYAAKLGVIPERLPKTRQTEIGEIALGVAGLPTRSALDATAIRDYIRFDLGKGDDVVAGMTPPDIADVLRKEWEARQQKKEPVPNPSKVLGLGEAAAACGLSVTVKKLRTMMRSRVVRYRELSREAYIFSMDDLPQLLPKKKTPPD